MSTAAHCEPADPVVGGLKAVKRILPKAYLETEDKPEGFINMSGERIKRVGNVTISLADEGVLAIQEQPVAACPGDSGGPLFNTTGELAGITSVSNITLTVWADLKNPANQTFLLTP